MSDDEFKQELAAKGFNMVQPARFDDPGWGMIDIGGGVWVSRWNCGSGRNDEVIERCTAIRSLLGDAPKPKPKPKAAAVPAVSKKKKSAARS